MAIRKHSTYAEHTFPMQKVGYLHSCSISVYQIFLGPTVISRNRLILTDGAASEYVPLIWSTGKNAALPQTVHGLCYFHLCVIGWSKHVQTFMTKNMKEKDTVVKMVNEIKFWVKSWFYDTETNNEYLFTRHWRASQ